MDLIERLTNLGTALKCEWVLKHPEQNWIGKGVTELAVDRIVELESALAKANAEVERLRDIIKSASICDIENCTGCKRMLFEALSEVQK
jgi:hypothetical protein